MTAQKEKPKYTGQFPEYPVLLYNHKRRQSRSAAGPQEREKLTADGFVEDPLPPESPDVLTQQEVALLQSLLSKAAKALAKLGHLSEPSNIQSSRKSRKNKPWQPTSQPC